jgi:hypothetical protein
MWTRLIIGICLVAAVAFVAAPAIAGSNDLQLVRVTTSTSSAPSGSSVWFKAVAKNLGPGTADNVDVTYSNEIRFTATKEVCKFPAVSADTPSCEFGAIPAGNKVIVKVIGTVSGAAGQYAKLTFCVTDETGTPDPNTSNDCTTARILITT